MKNIKISITIAHGLNRVLW